MIDALLAKVDSTVLQWEPTMKRKDVPIASGVRIRIRKMPRFAKRVAQASTAVKQAKPCVKNAMQEQ